MANDLTAFSRGDRHIEVAHVDLGQLFTHFEELNIPFFKDRTVTLKMNARETSIQDDASKLMRVLQNLINNAMEAIRSIGTEGLVQVTATDIGDTVLISIRDNGPGIPEILQATLFEPFVTHGKKEGTGLGTAIVKSIIEAHYGTIDFETSAEGTTFNITLPKTHPSED